CISLHMIIMWIKEDNYFHGLEITKIAMPGEIANFVEVKWEPNASENLKIGQARMICDNIDWLGKDSTICTWLEYYYNMTADKLYACVLLYNNAHAIADIATRTLGQDNSIDSFYPKSYLKNSLSTLYIELTSRDCDATQPKNMIGEYMMKIKRYINHHNINDKIKLARFGSKFDWLTKYILINYYLFECGRGKKIEYIFETREREDGCSQKQNTYDREHIPFIALIVFEICADIVNINIFLKNVCYNMYICLVFSLTSQSSIGQPVT
ncbi:hypothetical protein ACJX0J_006669, partial [Zea mays]